MARILLTEDDEAVRAFVGRALTMDGHAVTVAEDGEDGFDRLREADGAFDLLLTDIKMPYMDGIELARLAGRYYPDVPVLMMTGYADQRERAEDVNAVDVIGKPFTLAEIRAGVADVLGEPLLKAG